MYPVEILPSSTAVATSSSYGSSNVIPPQISPPSSPTMDVRAPHGLYSVVLSDDALLRERRIRDILQDEIRNYNFMETPAIRKGHQKCFIILTLIVSIFAVAAIFYFATQGKKMATDVLISSVVGIGGYILSGGYLCYSKYQTLQKYYGGIS